MSQSSLNIQIAGKAEQCNQLIKLHKKATGEVDIYIGSQHVGIGKLVNQNGHYAVRVLENFIKSPTA